MTTFSPSRISALRCFVLGSLLCLLSAGCSSRQSGSKPAGSGSGTDQSEQSKDSGKQQGGRQGGGGEQEGGSSSAPVDAVRITQDQQSRAGIVVSEVTAGSMPESLSVAGQVVMDDQHTSHIGALADGRIEQVNVLPGDVVRPGRVLATIHSHSVHETVGALAQGFAALDRQKSAVAFATQNRDRYARLLQIQAASVEESQRAEQELRQSEQSLKDAQASVHMEREHLSELLQVPPETLTPDHLYDRELVPIRSAQAGVVVTRSVTPSQVVTTGQELFVITNLSTVWATAAVNEKDLPHVKVGDAARVTVQGGRTLDGRIAMLGDVLDPQTRTVPVRVSVPNPHIELRPGMFVTIDVAEGGSQRAVFVPEDAVQEVNGLDSVFTTKDGQTFYVRAVTVGPRNGGMIRIRQGVEPGEKLVIHGGFQVKSELLKGSVGEG